MRTRAAQRTPRRKVEYVYPHSDGEPMGESQPHIEAIRRILDLLEQHYRNDPSVSVHGNMFWYWKEGDPTANRAPDAMVIPGVPMDHDRMSYMSWEHGGKVPTVIIETASRTTWRTNLTHCREDYEANGVREYFIFDGQRRYLPQPLIGYRLQRRKYQELEADADGGMCSRELKLRLVPEGYLLRFYTEDGLPVLTGEERERAEKERAIAELAEKDAQIAALKEKLRRAGLEPNGK